MGIKETILDWFKSYFNDCYQSVHVSGATSEPRYLHFFPTNISDQSTMVSLLSKNADGDSVSAHLYSDNTQLYLPFSLTEDAARRAVQQMEDCIKDARI